MNTPNPLHLASAAQNMARNAPKDDANVFNKVAMISMGVMAASSVVQMVSSLLRDLNRKESRRIGDRGRER